MTLRPAVAVSVLWLACAPVAPAAESALPWPPAHGAAAGATEFIDRALRANPSLRAADARHRAATHIVPQASALPDPVFGITQFIESVQTRVGPQEQVLALSQRVPWFGKLTSRERAARAGAESLRFDYDSRALRLARSVSERFFKYGFLERAIEITRENRDWLATLEPIIEERVRTGGDLNPLLRLKVEIGRVDDALQSLKQDQRVVEADLRDMLSLPAGTDLPRPRWVAPDPLIVDRIAALTMITVENPEISALRSQLVAARERREVARLQSYPDVTAGLSYIRVTNPAGGPRPESAGDDPWGVSIMFNVPVWTKKNRARIAEARAREESLEQSLSERGNGLVADLDAALSRLDDANRRLVLYGDELLGLAEQAVENSLTSYQAGRTGLLEVIDSERSLLDLQLIYWRAAAEAWAQLARVETLVGRSIPTGFAEKASYE